MFRKRVCLTLLCAILLLALVPAVAMAEDEWIPRDASGKVLKVTPESFYKYDDMSKHFDISFTINGWVNNQPMPADDPTAAWVEKTFNTTLKFASYDDETLATKVMAQIASGAGPDVLGIDQRVIVNKFLEQKMLSGDHKQYLQYVPALTQQYDAEGNDRLQATKNGVLFAIPKHEPQPEYYYIQVKQDWLDKLGLTQPTTDAELMKVAEAFTFKDPDGNGKADTWGFSTYNLDDMSNQWGGLDVFQAMYGNPGWYVENGRLTNPTLSGTRLKFLKYFRTAVEKGVMDPDYLNNVQWTTKKLQPGRVGIFAYHTDITGEAEAGLGMAGKLAGTWRMLEKPLKGDNGAVGGKRRPNTDKICMWIAFTKQGAKDQAKVKRFLHILDWWQYPNEGMFVMWSGYKMDPAFSLTKTRDYIYMGVDLSMKSERVTRVDWGILADYGRPGSWYPHVQWGSAKAPTATNLFALKQMDVVGAMDRYPGNLFYLCDIPSALDTKVKDFTRKNEVAFITGTRSLDTWDAYVKEWKTNGGQELANLMTKQLGALGKIK